MKCSLGISNFLEQISSLSHSIVFLYFFALITEEGFLISPCYSLELCIEIGVSSFYPLPFASLYTAICRASSDNTAFLPFCLSFLGDGLGDGSTHVAANGIILLFGMAVKYQTFTISVINFSVSFSKTFQLFYKILMNFKLSLHL